MDKLKDGIVLYHGSYCVVDDIDLSKCYRGKDFGRGFYLTTSYEQAKKFVRLSVKNAVNVGTLKEEIHTGFVNSYRFELSDIINEFDFHEADVNWLHFVAGNRDEELFRELTQDFSKYNVVGGKIANDRTAATLSQYVNGIFGNPGEPEADEIAIKLLLPNRLEDQYCFRSGEAISCLHFQNAEEVTI